MASVISQAIKKKQEAIKNKNSGLSQNVPNKNTASGSTVGASSPYSAISNVTQGIKNSGVNWKPSTGGSSGSSSGGSSGGNSGGNSQYTNYRYTIGSDKGKDIALNLPIYGTFNASDGSVWTKEPDGSITVDYNGEKYQNAYTPSDYSVILKQQKDAGVPYQYIEDTLDLRTNKALKDPSLNDYAHDGIFWQMTNYINEQKNAEEIAKYEALVNELNQDRPEDYQSKYDPKIDEILNEILNREDFSYNAMNDPLYQQYADMYHREGDRAMKETLAEAAAGAGGMNTYAITAAQQANSYYNSKLNDKIPELYQLAYEMYLNDKESKVQDLGILQNMDATQYKRYRDTINDFYTDRNFAYGAYLDAVQQGNWQTNHDYNSTWDKINYGNNEYWNKKEWDYNDEWKNKEWEANRGDIEYERNQYDKETAENKMWEFIDRGVMPSEDVIAQAGWTKADVELLLSGVLVGANITPIRGRAISGGSSSKSGSTSSSKKSDDKVTTQPVKEPTQNSDSKGLKHSTVINPYYLGIGPISDEAVLDLYDKGAVKINDDGTVKWSDGYNANNYEALIKTRNIFPSLLF